MSLLTIPTEVLLQILPLLDASSLKSLRLTNSLFRVITADILFKKLHLNFGCDVIRGRCGSRMDDGSQCPELVGRLEVLLTRPSNADTSKRTDPFNGITCLKELSVRLCSNENHLGSFHRFCTQLWGRLLSLFPRIGRLRLDVSCFQHDMEAQSYSLAEKSTAAFYNVLSRRLQEGMAVERLRFGSEVEYLKLLPPAVRGLKSLEICPRGKKPFSKEEDPGSEIYRDENRDNPVKLKMDSDLAGVWSEFGKHLGRMIHTNRDTLEEWEFTHTCKPGFASVDKLLGLKEGQRVMLDYILDEIPDDVLLGIKKLYSFGGFPPEPRNLKKLARLEEINRVEGFAHDDIPAVSPWTALRASGVKLQRYCSKENRMTAEYLEYLVYASSRPGGVKSIQIPNISPARGIPSTDAAATVFNHDFGDALTARTIPSIQTTVRNLYITADITPFPDNSSMELVTPLLHATPAIRSAWIVERESGRSRRDEPSCGNPSITFAQLMDILRDWDALEVVTLDLQKPGYDSYRWRSIHPWKAAYTSTWIGSHGTSKGWNEKLKVTLKHASSGALWGLRMRDGVWRLEMENDWGEEWRKRDVRRLG